MLSTGEWASLEGAGWPTFVFSSLVRVAARWGLAEAKAWSICVCHIQPGCLG